MFPSTPFTYNTEVLFHIVATRTALKGSINYFSNAMKLLQDIRLSPQEIHPYGQMMNDQVCKFLIRFQNSKKLFTKLFSVALE